MSLLYSKIVAGKKDQRHFVSAGFTLLEMIVALFIFSIVVTIATGALLSIIAANRKAQALKTVINNVNLALDVISRDVRFGTTYRAYMSSDFGTQCTSTCSAFSVVNPATGVTIGYYLQDGKIFRKKGTDSGQEITSAAAVIEYLKFSIVNTSVSLVDSGTRFAPRVFVTLSGYAGADQANTQNKFNLQTTMTPRNF